MDTWELERDLRNSSMDYSLKASRYLYDVAQTPCPNCPFKNEDPPVPLVEKTKKCFQRCEFKIVIWILSKEQFYLYEQLRPPEKKKEEMELAITTGRIAQVEENLREGQKIEIISPSFYKKVIIKYVSSLR